MVENKRRSIGKLLDRLNTQVTDLHKTTYHSNGINDDMMNKVSGELTASIQKAINGDSVYADMSNTTMLYSKLFKSSNNPGQTIIPIASDKYRSTGEDNILDLFQDSSMMASLMETYSQSKYLKALDDEIDTVLKHMPKLQTALNIKKDTVLCTDSFNKSFILANKENQIEGQIDDKFDNNMKACLEEYEFEQKAEEWYDNAQKYGEQYVYIVPYKKAVSEMLNRKKSTNYSIKETAIFENGDFTNEYRWNGYKESKPSANSSIQMEGGAGPSIRLSLNKMGLLQEPIEAVRIASELKNNLYCKSIYEQFLTESVNDYKKVQLQKSIPDELEYEDDATASDGLVGAKKNKDLVTPNQIKVPGCIVKSLDRWDVIPLYIEDICLGYYYIQLNMNNEYGVDPNVSMIGTEAGTGTMTSMFANNMDKDMNGDRVLRHIAGKISENITTSFINTNHNLKKEIYMMLRYNDKFNRVADSMDLNVTFIPPEDILHIKFNEDPKTHRGVSDIWDGLIAAKMWIMLNSTSVIGNVTRGQDKRVYYVKTTVETNVAKTLLNVVSQIKKGNFGLRQMESVNNIIQSVGKFNDFVIPVGPSGDSPITFDIMQGQQFDLPAELMNNLEESAIGTSGVPLEMVNSASGIDFAIRYTMTNGRLLRDTLKRQSMYAKMLSKAATKIYNCSYNENIKVKIKLPAPLFLMITQGSQLIQNTTQYIDTISDIYGSEYNDSEKAMFKRLLMNKNLPSYIDLDMIKETMAEVELASSVAKTENEVLNKEE